jgi:hypothetical protein
MSAPSLAHSRAAFHREHQAAARELAEYLLSRREALQGGWLTWVAGQLYALSPAPFAAMVRRELEQMNQG